MDIAGDKVAERQKPISSINRVIFYVMAYAPAGELMGYVIGQFRLTDLKLTIKFY